MGPYAGVDNYKLTFCPLQSRLQHIYHGHARVDLNPMPETTLSPQSGTLNLASGFTGYLSHMITINNYEKWKTDMSCP
jgi:hypothetical protein